MASIIKLKNGKWRAQIRRKGFKDITKQCDTKSEAIAWAAQTEKDMKQGVAPESKTKTVSDLILEYRKSGASTGQFRISPLRITP